MPDLRQFAFVGLGSNLGDPARHVRRALIRLQVLSTVPLLCSSLWKSEPVDCPPGSPPFVNAVAGLLPRPGETPHSLLESLLQIEREFGRKPKLVMNEPRPIDLDLLAFGTNQFQTPKLTVPHPRAHLRKFVLAPLNEIAPALVLPGFSQTVGRLLAALPSDQVAEKLA